MTQDSFYNESQNVQVAIVPPGTTSHSTQSGLPTPGSVATYKVFVVLNNASQAGSNPVTIQRP
jgi:hypothetical protein